MNIKTWEQRIKPTKDISSRHIQTCMKEEIGELRAENERLTLGWNAANVDVLHHAMIIDAQRKVLEQALKALETCGYEDHGSHEPEFDDDKVDSAITAIQEQLK